jgi:NAD(P)-dependent dehydrogenase (short-subunit alcohol dehydrogenase family)
MRDFAGKTAFVTGAAQGIGLGICKALAGAGVNVALADIQPDKLEAARAEIEALGVRAVAIPLDVSDAGTVEAAAGQVESAFGRLHILVNNAGVVAPPTPVSAVTLDQWNWLFGVNVYGVIHGLRYLLPLIREHRDGGHVVNTASIAGLQVRPGRGTGSYAATKYAVVAISESLEQELAGTGIGVSVLCPAAVNTAIYKAPALRPERFGGPFQPPPDGAAETRLDNGWPPDAVGARVLEAMKNDEFFILTHPSARPWIENRHRRLMVAFDAAARYERDHGPMRR